MAMYYRYTNKNTPMSDWGHAMFAADEYKVENYGRNRYTYDGKDGVHISDLYEAIVIAWNEDRENGFRGDFGGQCNESFWREVSAEEVYDSFCPADIVDSAEAWDSELVQWIWERVLEPRGIYAVLLDDGAIVFDESLIVLAG